MRVFLVRHAAAVPEDYNLADMYRYLSPTGRQAAIRQRAQLAELGAELACIYTSPLTRAVQTAELLGGAAIPVIAVQALAPYGRLQDAADEVTATGEDVAVIGHQVVAFSKPGFLVHGFYFIHKIAINRSALPIGFGVDIPVT